MRGNHEGFRWQPTGRRDHARQALVLSVAGPLVAGIIVSLAAMTAPPMPEAETQIPLILNTSFNRGESIVARPKEAISCYLRTAMDVLVLGDFYVTDRNQRPAETRTRLLPGSS